jgi:glycerol-3-phosphate dehydrogenase
MYLPQTKDYLQKQDDPQNKEDEELQDLIKEVDRSNPEPEVSQDDIMRSYLEQAGELNGSSILLTWLID